MGGTWRTCHILLAHMLLLANASRHTTVVAQMGQLVGYRSWAASRGPRLLVPRVGKAGAPQGHSQVSSTRHEYRQNEAESQKQLAGSGIEV